MICATISDEYLDITLIGVQIYCEATDAYKILIQGAALGPSLSRGLYDIYTLLLNILDARRFVAPVIVI